MRPFIGLFDPMYNWYLRPPGRGRKFFQDLLMDLSHVHHGSFSLEEGTSFKLPFGQTKMAMIDQHVQ